MYSNTNPAPPRSFPRAVSEDLQFLSISCPRLPLDPIYGWESSFRVTLYETGQNRRCYHLLILFIHLLKPSIGGNHMSSTLKVIAKRTSVQSQLSSSFSPYSPRPNHNNTKTCALTTLSKMAQFSQRPFDMPLQGMHSQISLPPSPPHTNTNKDTLHSQMLPSNAARGSDDSKRSKGLSLTSLLGRRNSAEKTTKSRSQFPLRGGSRGVMLSLYAFTDLPVQLGISRRSVGQSQILSQR